MKVQQNGCYFLPYIHPKHYHFSVFYIKLPGASPPPEHHPGPHGGLTAPPIPQAAKKMVCPYFSWIILNIKLSVTLKVAE